MGWTVYPEYANTTMTPKRYWKEIYLPDVPNWIRDEPNRCQVVAENSHNREFYAAIRDNKKDITFGLVVLIEKDRNGIAVKEMDASVGPCYYNASDKVLQALSEPVNDFDKKWRERCAAYKQRLASLQKTVASVKDGMMLEFSKSFVIDGKPCNVFCVVDSQKNLFSCQDTDTVYRIPDWKKIDFKIIH